MPVPVFTLFPLGSTRAFQNICCGSADPAKKGQGKLISTDAPDLTPHRSEKGPHGSLHQRLASPTKDDRGGCGLMFEAVSQQHPAHWTK